MVRLLYNYTLNGILRREIFGRYQDLNPGTFDSKYNVLPLELRPRKLSNLIAKSTFNQNVSSPSVNCEIQPCK